MSDTPDQPAARREPTIQINLVITEDGHAPHQMGLPADVFADLLTAVANTWPTAPVTGSTRYPGATRVDLTPDVVARRRVLKDRVEELASFDDDGDEAKALLASATALPDGYVAVKVDDLDSDDTADQLLAARRAFDTLEQVRDITRD